jgi:anaerobic dimethyl sulfoxide reductase subunit B (iron-sulfur subunit)
MSSPAALASPSSLPAASGPKPGFTLDLARCVGCGACVLACRIENQLPAGVSWRRVIPVNLPRYGGGPTYHLSVSCHHCEAPPCVGACPSGALEKGQDGLVLLEADLCIGCRYCEMACPFGAPSFDAQAKVMTKCHLCHTRLAEGLAPACVTACPTQALGFLAPGEVGDEGPGPASPGFLPATETPGFHDPAGARPGFHLGPPGGSLRAEAMDRLREALEKKGGEG